ncbi:aminotransferase class III-fold pyridoxal phosphate-dependent enzyme [Acetobacterium wieringae]|nr:aminotransferase class III-fold pyridoxal phosphate-dependent enzyme [Acetobacterium wieringae]URN86210.1 aminotransferase class III-fold pyridoxal phosphate-dependent enzyme [Acetobacterium wieringae]
MEALKKEHPSIKEVRGMGLIVGVQIDADLGAIVAKAMEKGLLLITAGSNAIRFVPPLVVTKKKLIGPCRFFLNVYKKMGQVVPFRLSKTIIGYRQSLLHVVTWGSDPTHRSGYGIACPILRAGSRQENAYL